MIASIVGGEALDFNAIMNKIYSFKRYVFKSTNEVNCKVFKI